MRTMTSSFMMYCNHENDVTDSSCIIYIIQLQSNSKDFRVTMHYSSPKVGPEVTNNRSFTRSQSMLGPTQVVLLLKARWSYYLPHLLA